MAKISLTKEQLQVLRVYIYNKGFRDPVSIVEILDHFACKVEELLEENSNLDLETAMRGAHVSFGVYGFKTIVDNLGKEVLYNYKKYYWNNFRKIVTSIQTIPLIILAGLIIYYSYIWSFNKGLVFWEKYTYLGSALLIIYILSEFYTILKSMPSIKKASVFLTSAFQQGYNRGILTVFIVSQSLGVDTLNYSTIRLKLTAFIIAIISVYIVIHVIARYKTIRLALKDTSIREESYKSLID